MAKSQIIQVADDFWNIRGSFKIGYVADIGTHISLIRLQSGKFVFLDSYTLSPKVKQEIDKLTNGGKDIEGILNLHPFNTIHVTKMHEMFPDARLYGTARHCSKFPDLPWDPLHTEDTALHEKFAEDLDFSVPQGVDFISSNDNIHFSSVLVMHPASKTIHVDDTFMYVQPPILKKWIELPAALSFHPTLVPALQRRAGAANEFRQWAKALAHKWQDAENLCAAHTGSLLHKHNKGAPISVRMMKALRNVRWVLAAHEKWYANVHIL